MMHCCHCMPLTFSKSSHISWQVAPVSDDLNGKVGWNHCTPHCPSARFSVGLHAGREQGGDDPLHDLGLEALLRGLFGERVPVGVDHDALHDLAAFLLELGDLLGEILARLHVGAAVDERVALGRPVLAAAVRLPVRVTGTAVGPHGADLLVGVHLGEHVPLDRLLLGQPPEEVVGPLERFVRGATALEHEDFHRDVDGEAGHVAAFAHVGHRSDGVAGSRAQDKVDLGVVDEVTRHLGGTVGVRLAVDDLYVERVALAVAEHDAFGGLLGPFGDAVAAGHAERPPAAR